MSTQSQRVLILQDASRAPGIVPVRHVVYGLSLGFGDKIEFLGIIQAFRETNRLNSTTCGSLLSVKPLSAVFGKRFSLTKLHSSATINKHKQDIEQETQKTLERYSSCQEFKEMIKISESLQVEFEIAVEAGSLKEVAVEYAKRSKATHVILDRQLGRELKYFTKNLSCGISQMKSDNRIEIVRPSQMEEVGSMETTTPNIETREERGNYHFTCSICMNRRRPWLGLKSKFTYAELQIATNGFCKQNSMPDHGKKIYLGFLNDQRSILIREIPSVTNKEENFQREIQVLEGIRHDNLALLIGSCSEGQHRFLVYEYICNGSLNKHLSNENRELTWERRVSIVYGAAKGLECLHESRIYGTMRPSNILITHDYQPLLSYYGFINQYEALRQSSETTVLRTFEYLAPEYQETGISLSKADVYSFGVVLLELITGRKTIDSTDGQSFLRWARPLLNEKKYMELVDPVFQDSVDLYQLYWLVHVADKCLSWDPKSRYSMKMVVTILSGMINRTVVEDFSPTEYRL